MHVYFVRHGETLLNARHIHQSPNTPLSPQGREEVVTTAEYLRGVNPERIFTSEYTRALETARIIGSIVGVKPETNGLLYEIERPSKFYGKSRFTLETYWYMFLSVINRNNRNWHYADAENLVEIFDRIRRARGYLESLHGTCNSIVVVSHTAFTNLLIARMCKEEMLSVKDILRSYIQIETMKNGSIVHLEYAGAQSKGTCAWSLVNRT